LDAAHAAQAAERTGGAWGLVCENEHCVRRRRQIGQSGVCSHPAIDEDDDAIA
jgi:hypothetical protein